MAPWSNGRLRLSPLWLVLALGIPCLASSLLAGWGLPAVVASGMCPPAPADIATYPCSPLEYVLRMTLGPWALAGHLTIWFLWLSLTAVVWLAFTFLLRPTRAAVRPPDPPSGRSE